MKRAELLGILLKTIGFWSILGGISGLPQAISSLHQYPDEQAFFMMMGDTLVAPIMMVVAGWFLIRSTDWFVRIAQGGANLAAFDESDEGARERFAAVLIAFGYWEILNGVIRLPYEFARLSRASVWTFEVIGYVGITIVAGCFLVFASDWFVQFAYRPQVSGIDDELEADAS
jgi:hypothetical protein